MLVSASALVQEFLEFLKVYLSVVEDYYLNVDSIPYRVFRLASCVLEIKKGISG